MNFIKSFDVCLLIRLYQTQSYVCFDFFVCKFFLICFLKTKRFEENKARSTIFITLESGEFVIPWFCPIATKIWSNWQTSSTALWWTGVTAQFYLESKGKYVLKAWGHADPKDVKRGPQVQFWLLFLYVFSPPLGLPYVNWASQECCLFYLRSSLRSSDLSLFCFRGLFPSLSFSHCHFGLLFTILTTQQLVSSHGVCIYAMTFCIHCFSIAKSCPTLCDPMNCSKPGFPVLHYLSEFAQTHVQWVSDAIQLSNPLLCPFLPAFYLFQHQGLSQWISSLHQVTKVLDLQHQS